MAVKGEKVYDALSDINVRERGYSRQNAIKNAKQSDEDSFSNASSLFNIANNEELVKTYKTVAQTDKTSVFFWLKRSDFYVTGFDFVLSQVAIVTQQTAMPFYLQKVCGFVTDDPD